MINITFSGVDPYLLRGLSKDLTEKIAELCEVKKEDILFIANDGLLVFQGVEQNDWYALISVEMPGELEIFEKKFVELLKLHMNQISLHFEVTFKYYHYHSNYKVINEDYPIYIDEANQVFLNEESEETNASSEENSSLDGERVYLGNAFEDFESKLKK